ncbi:xanthine dehydrogenase family protein molybdopterin-binding subunit [Oxalobacteraceae bacterium CAVE-383]|nr:xanthine dehydrogenase family protein molybdopterin-binding subunit [Oxalobacteraceae bacterium CAVE-383]
MSLPATTHVTPKAGRRALLDGAGVLLITRAPQPAAQPAPGQPGAASSYLPSQPDVFIAVQDSGRIMAFNGHVDLGTGIRTSLAQIVAEEMDVPLSHVTMVLGHTEAAPNQGPTIASATIQISAVPLRRAAAQARLHLLQLAASMLALPAEELHVIDGVVCHRLSDRAIGYGSLVSGRHIELPLADEVVLKPSADYRLVGRSMPRVDIPAKAFGELTYVHDLRLPGMLHGRVVRPPYAGLDSGDFVGHSLIGVDRGSIAHLPGIVEVVVIGDFIGVVAEREEQAVKAARQLKVTWKPHPPLPDMRQLESTMRGRAATRRMLIDDNAVDRAMADAHTVLHATYVWPYQLHASIGPSCALASLDPESGQLSVWSGTQNPHVMRIDLARLLKMDESNIEIIRMEAAGCYGRNCADDVCADAALLTRATGRPVRVQLSREQEHAWEPKGAAQLVDVSGAADADGNLLAYDFSVRYPSNDAPTLALLLTGTVSAQPRVLEMGDRTAAPPYRYRHKRIVCNDLPAIVRAAWLRGVSALPNSFAHDAFLDEMAVQSGADRVAFRIRHLDDARAIELIEAVASRAGWENGARGSRGAAGADGLLRGRGVAYARYIHSKFPGFGAAWSAWIIDVSVDPVNGAVRVERLVVGQDTGMMVNPDGVRHQLHGNVIQSLSRVLKEEARFSSSAATSLEWGAYPIARFSDVPPIEVVLMPRQDQPPLGAGESASVPSAAALANALFDAMGKRLREPPFTAARILAALNT